MLDFPEIFYLDGTPEEFLEALVFHELRKAEERYDHGVPLKEAEKIAKRDAVAYVEKFFGAEKRKRFIEWQKRFSAYACAESA